MNRVILAITSLFLVAGAMAQLDYGGQPASWAITNQDADIPTYTTEAIDLDRALEEDAVTDQYKETPYRFGIEHEVSIDFFDHAEVLQSVDGRTIYRMALECPTAVSVNFLFDSFFLPEGSELYVYSSDRSVVKGQYNEASNKDSGIFPVGLVHGDRAIIEYVAPAGLSQANLHISQIVHGYRNMINKWETQRGPFGSSGACNINANCDEGIPWEAQNRSVAVIVQGGNGVCSGALVNNTAQDETPYFLTANHCLGTPAAWLYYFNHETPACIGSTGPINNSINGGTLRASSAGSDFALIELDDNVPVSWDPYFAGWDNSDATSVTGAVGIHHPGGDVKKICFEEDSPYHTNQGGAAVWYIDEWELGVTEGGSSGSPLFDQNGRVIGQLYGGFAACAGNVNNGQADWYGRLGVSWDGGGASNSRLSNWLDPSNSGVTTLDGYGPNDVIFPNDVASQGISDVPDLLCDMDPFAPTFTLRNSGSNTLTSAIVTATYNGIDMDPINWTGSLEQGETQSVTLANFTPAPGTNTIDVEVSSPNGGDDDNEINNSASTSIATAPTGVGNFIISILTDNWSQETSWDVTDASGAVIAQSTIAYVNNTQYEEEVELPNDGCYTVTVYDSAGDGVCCGFGQGDLTITDSNGTILIEGGDFGDAASGTFAMDVNVSVEELQTTDFAVYPNPTNDVVNISLSESIGNYRVDVINTLGQVLLTENINGAMQTQLNVADLASGNYMIQISGETSTGVQRLSVR